MASVSFARIGLAASVAGLTVFSVQAASAAGPASACPGQAWVGPSAATVPAPGKGGTGVTTIYDQEGQIVRVTNSLGETAYLTPAPTAAPVATFTDPLGHVTRFSYDATGSVAQVVDPMGETTRYQYDSSNRADTVTDPQGRVTTYDYNAGGNLAHSADPAGVTTTYAYDSGTGRITGDSDTTGHTTTYSYSSGELTSVTDSSGRTTTYTYYDPGGQLETETVTPPPGGVTTTYMYDSAGNVLSITESGGPRPSSPTTLTTASLRIMRSAIT